jgi:hypothetical protein
MRRTLLITFGALALSAASAVAQTPAAAAASKLLPDTVTTDKQGMFAFKGVDPGNYVVEVMSPANNAVMASSQVLNVSTGEAISALVKLPFRIPPFAGLIGNSSQTTASAVSTAAQAVTAAAASSNTVAETLSGVPATCATWPKCP